MKDGWELWRKERRKEERYQGDQEPRVIWFIAESAVTTPLCFLQLLLIPSLEGIVGLWLPPMFQDFFISFPHLVLNCVLSNSVFSLYCHIPPKSSQILFLPKKKKKPLQSEDPQTLKSISFSLKTGDLYGVSIVQLNSGKAVQPQMK